MNRTTGAIQKNEAYTEEIDIFVSPFESDMHPGRDAFFYASLETGQESNYRDSMAATINKFDAAKRAATKYIRENPESEEIVFKIHIVREGVSDMIGTILYNKDLGELQVIEKKVEQKNN